jgi:hypothetical protein
MTSVIILSAIILAIILFVGKYTRFHVPDNDIDLAKEEE